MLKQNVVNSIAFAGTALTAAGIMSSQQKDSFTFWILLTSVVFLFIAAILELFLVESK